MEAEDGALRERLVALKLQRDEISKEIADLRLTSAAPVVTPEKISKVAILLRDRLYNGPAELRQAYARLLMDEVRVSDEEIRISGSKAVLARCASSSDGLGEAAPTVLSFVGKWRARRDSNSRPPDS
jgi:site-specific DNA recombinase